MMVSKRKGREEEARELDKGIESGRDKRERRGETNANGIWSECTEMYCLLVPS